MLSTSASFEYALNTFQPSWPLVFHVFRNARKTDAAGRFEFMYGFDVVAAGRDIVHDDSECEPLRRHINHLEQLRRDEHVIRPDGLQLLADKHRTGDDISVVVFQCELAYRAFDTRPQAFIVLAVLRNDVS